jgi:hypothetical protein
VALAGERLDTEAVRCCSYQWHRWVAGSRELFDACTTYVGLQDDGEGGWLILGNCRACNSTLALLDDGGGEFA